MCGDRGRPRAISDDGAVPAGGPPAVPGLVRFATVADLVASLCTGEEGVMEDRRPARRPTRDEIIGADLRDLHRLG